MTPSDFVSAAGAYARLIGGRIETCWSVDRPDVQCGKGDPGIRRELWTIQISRGRDEVPEAIREKAARSFGFGLRAGADRDSLAGFVERTLPWVRPS